MHQGIPLSKGGGESVFVRVDLGGRGIVKKKGGGGVFCCGEVSRVAGNMKKKGERYSVES